LGVRKYLRIIVFFSYRGGTGKTTIMSNVAASMYLSGMRVGVIDFDIVSPGASLLFGTEDKGESVYSLLKGEGGVDEAVIDLTPDSRDGKLYLIPARLSEDAIFGIIRDGYTLHRLNKIVRDFGKMLGLDVIFVDTHPGFSEDTLVFLVLSDLVVMVVRPDIQDVYGAKLSVSVLRRLRCNPVLLVNMVPSSLVDSGIGEKIASTLGLRLVETIPFYEDVLSSMSREVFALTRRDHPFSRVIDKVAHEIGGGGL
jgi:MinD-like ATPase involved in chromosome partitioning or flagellar assembly